MAKYVIFLSSKSQSYPYEDYGYWLGKSYVSQGISYPCCERELSENTKRYKSNKLAENMAEKLYGKYSEVSGWKVVEVTS